MFRAEVSLFPSYRPALSGVQLQGHKRRRSRDRRPKRIPGLDSAGNSALEYISPLLLWCTSGQYWPSSEGPVCRASSRWVCLLLAFVTLGPPKQGLCREEAKGGHCRVGAVQLQRRVSPGHPPERGGSLPRGVADMKGAGRQADRLQRPCHKPCFGGPTTKITQV